jgi:hypothetical protein
MTNINQLFYYFRLTGDKKYLVNMPDVFDWVDSAMIPAYMRQQTASNPAGDPDSILTGTHARVSELKTNRPRFPHRFGSNIHNGGYYFDYDWRFTPSHYGASSNSSTTTARATYARMMALSNAEIAAMVAKSPLNVMSERPLPKYFSVNGEVDFPHLFEGSVKGTAARTAAQNATILSDLGTQNYWSANQSNLTNPYTRNGDTTLYEGKEYMSKNVGDTTDTSPFANSSRPDTMPGYTTAWPTPPVINSSTFVSNMGQLISFLTPVTQVIDPNYKS